MSCSTSLNLGYLTAETNVDIQIIKLCVQGKRKGRIRLNSMQGEGKRGNEGEKERKNA